MIDAREHRLESGRRIGKRIGSVISTAANVAAGYVWARYGVEWAFVVLGSLIVGGLALYGAAKFPWGEH